MNDFYLFALGTKLFNGRIPIFRLGGHVEKNEAAWQCVTREVKEEASITISHIKPPTCYLANGDDPLLNLKEIKWEAKPLHPLLAVYYAREQTTLSIMYLAQTNEIPKPSAEIKGLVLLSEADVHSLCSQTQTLKTYLENGGQAILNFDFDTNLKLEPFTQLRLLSKILSLNKLS